MRVASIFVAAVTWLVAITVFASLSRSEEKPSFELDIEDKERARCLNNLMPTIVNLCTVLADKTTIMVEPSPCPWTKAKKEQLYVHCDEAGGWGAKQ